nr:secretory carrier-associated membrane protein 2 [Ipomoea batatas]
MAGRYDRNPREDDEVNPFAGTGRVPPATNSPDPAGFYNNGSVDISLDSAADLKRKEKELQGKEAELSRREQVYVNEHLIMHLHLKGCKFVVACSIS